MRLVNLFLSLLVIGAIGCTAQKIEDKDLVGTWNVDPAAMIGKDKNDVMSKMSFHLTENHQYTMTGPVPMTLKGSWVYSDKKLNLAPTSIEVQNSSAPNGKSEFPVSALKQMESMAPDEQIKKALTTMGEQLSFDVSDDGKKLSSEGKGALIKTE